MVVRKGRLLWGPPKAVFEAGSGARTRLVGVASGSVRGACRLSCS